MSADLPFAVYLYTSPISMIFYFIVIEFLYRIITLIIQICWRTKLKIRLLVYLCLILISVSFNFTLLFTSDIRESPVDVTPIAQLDSEQIGRLKDVLIHFENRHGFQIVELQNPTRSFCSFSYGRVSVTVEFFEEETDILRSKEFRWARFREYGYAIIYNHNNTEVWLGNSFMERSYGFPNSLRFVHTLIRLDNALIHLWEIIEQHEMPTNHSTDFIRVLSELLKHNNFA